MTMLPGDTLCDSHALFLGLVCQHGASHHVPDGPDPRQVGSALVIDHNCAALIKLQANGLGVQAHGIRYSANGHDQFVNIELLSFALGVGIGNADRVGRLADRSDLDTELNLQPLLVKCLLGFLGDLLIHSPQESGQAFEHGDCRAQAPPDRPHLQADDT